MYFGVGFEAGAPRFTATCNVVNLSPLSARASPLEPIMTKISASLRLDELQKRCGSTRRLKHASPSRERRALAIRKMGVSKMDARIRKTRLYIE